MTANCEIIINGVKITTKGTNTKEILTPLKHSSMFTRISLKNLTALQLTHHVNFPNPMRYLSFSENFGKIINETEETQKQLDSAPAITRIENSIFKKNIAILIGIIVLILIVRYLLKRFC